MSNPKNKVRVIIAALAFSAAGFATLVEREGYSDRAIADPVHGAAVPTSGFGTTGPDIKMGDKTDPVKAVRRAVTDMQKKEKAIKACVSPDVELTQIEYDLYADLGYNVGEGNFCYRFVNKMRTGPSTLVRRLNAHDYLGACDAILLYKYAGGLDCSIRSNNCWGVWQRRLDANAQCRAAVEETVTP